MGVKRKGFMCPVICFMVRFIIVLQRCNKAKGGKTQNFGEIRTDWLVGECEISALFNCLYHFIQNDMFYLLCLEQSKYLY